MRNKGFTLIELVVVIVILGILAVVAAPKFMGLQQEARIADLKGLEGSLKAANEMVYAKAAMKGLEQSQREDGGGDGNAGKNQIIIDGQPIALHFGYITAGKENIERILNVSRTDWNILGYAGFFSPIYLTPKTATAFNATSPADIEKSNCYLSYGFLNPHDGPWNIPQYKLVTSGC
ncbi:prepilin-type N-terminal cleavage/methylation domain-containing protein [Photobacterium carnosum]|uniref:type II secretion system protein n=1 Tax=Photobacterium carnosum TaxID=2023717 RepID=UPI001F8DC53A|nr:prepilin-type N-terminal cleavage/methylation domain-containing protein [Photobacterium carnosum]MCD9545371.1 prepilin-type N-terminal cleavage/methylation domain-containing protein [Photobacterium carnosum]MCD9547977.1 prepilin-type N-terminal cleavage/methylation domain-containing protein [Photobacterium carnosum]MCF2305226.1 prepilin-type N-terminal cleavage/methylation domain-containing protein [Photobacterium carnosum]